METRRTLAARTLIAGLALAVLAWPDAASAAGYKFKTKEGCGIAHYRKAWAEANVKSMSWTGKCKNGLAQGKGLLTVKLTDGRTETYDGKMNKGYFGGSSHDNHGEYVDSDGVKRVGDFLNNRLYSGQVFNPDGTLLYDGTFSFKTGNYDHGKLYWEDGGYIEGTFEPDATSTSRNGLGIMYGEVKDKDGKTLAYYFRGQRVADAETLQRLIANLQQQLAEERAREQEEAERQAAAEQAQRDADDAAAYAQLTQVLGAYAQQLQQPQRPAYTAPAYTPPAPVYSPPVYQSPSYTPQQPTYSEPSAPSGPMHHPELEATQCVQLINDQWGRLQMHNGCGFAIELTWCVVGIDCNPGFSNTWTLGAGNDWPVAGSGQRQVQYAACRGANTIHAIGAPSEMRFMCY